MLIIPFLILIPAIVPSNGLLPSKHAWLTENTSETLTPLSDRLSEEEVYDRIANPALLTPQAVEDRIAHLSAVLKEVSAMEGSAISRGVLGQVTHPKRLRRLMALFLEFAQPASGWELDYIDRRIALQMPSSIDPVSAQRLQTIIGRVHATLREKWQREMKLTLPAGFLFIKLYADEDEMRREYGLNPETVGVAFPCRFIAIALPYQEQTFWGAMKRAFVTEEFKQTVAHELVHAFCFMTVGYARARTLPRWFMEGFAVYFSGERRVRTAIEGPGGTIIRDFGSTEEYRQFRRLFQFVEEKYGRGRLLQFVRRSLEGGSVKRALSSVLHLSDEVALVGAAVSWRREKERFQRRSMLVVTGLVLLALGLLRGRRAGWRWPVAVFIIWVATIDAARSPFYIHTSFWQVPVALGSVWIYLTVHTVRRRRAMRSERLRLIVFPDEPRRDETVEPWPYEHIDIARGISGGESIQWGWSEVEVGPSEAATVREFLQAQATDVFYFRGRTYRVWSETIPG